MSNLFKIACSLSLALFITTLLFLGGCASIQSPQGGPRDTNPPKVLKMEPKNLTTNFATKKIVIQFDEYIKLDNEFKEFSMSPESETPPKLKVKLRTLEITLPDTLEKNTTYTLNFGKAITDINEGNAIKNFTYVFATGPILDSLTISGNVKNAVTDKPEIEALVFIVPLQKDSIFGKKKPSIFTLTDSSGNYQLKNLKKDTYKVYSLKEKGGDKIYQQLNDEVGFVKEPLKLESNADKVDMVIFKEVPTTFRVLDKKISPEGSVIVNVNQKLKKPELVVIEPIAYNDGKFFRTNKTNDSLRLWVNKLDFDSVKIAIKDGGIVKDAIKITRGKKDTYNTEIKAGDNLDGGLLNPTKPLDLFFNLPVTNIDISKVVLLEDSIPRKGLTITKDTTDFLTYHLSYPWRTDEDYILQLKDGAVTGIYNAKNKEIKKTFKRAKTDDYASVKLNVTVPDTTKTYIIDLMNEKKDAVVGSKAVKTNQKITFPNYKAGIYYIRVTYDENNNGMWDTGNIATGTQPEKFWHVPKESSIRANWDREDELKIPNVNEIPAAPVVQPTAPKSIPTDKTINPPRGSAGGTN